MPRARELSGLLLSEQVFHQPRGKIVVPVPSAAVFFSGLGTNSKSAWASLLDPIPSDIHGLFISTKINSTGRDFLIDIGIGPSGGGGEVVVLANLQYSSSTTSAHGSQYLIPLYLPASAGKRLSARVQGTGATPALPVTVWPLYKRTRYRLLRSVETLGANTADSGGVSVDPGATINTKGAYSTIGTTTKQASEILLVVGNQANTVRTNADAYAMDLAIGATPDILYADMVMIASATNDILMPSVWGPFPCDIPAGTDVKVRASCPISDATDRLFDATVYCFSESK